MTTAGNRACAAGWTLADRQDARTPAGPLQRARAARWGGAAAALFLAGCGFQLQGRAPLPTVVKTPYLEAPDPQSDFIQYLRHDLLSNGAQLQYEKTHASAVVSILSDRVARRALVVSSNNRVNQYEVTYTVAFTVTSQGKELLPPQELSATRDFSFDESLLLAKRHEEDILRQDMARNLADEVMRRLSSL